MKGCGFMSRFSKEYIKYLVKSFNELPDKAKELCFISIFKLQNFDDSILETVSECESPIEKIFFIAFEVTKELRSNEIPKDYLDILTLPQYPISYENHEYYADFMIILENINDSRKSVDLIIECDGHDFHERTKEQVKHDNERTLILKKHGEDVLRFSGSQIYNEPVKCANDVFDYILTKVKAVQNGNL